GAVAGELRGDAEAHQLAPAAFQGRADAAPQEAVVLRALIVVDEEAVVGLGQHAELELHRAVGAADRGALVGGQGDGGLWPGLGGGRRRGGGERALAVAFVQAQLDRKSTRLNSSHVKISYAVFCLKKKKGEIAAR